MACARAVETTSASGACSPARWPCSASTARPRPKHIADPPSEPGLYAKVALARPLSGVLSYAVPAHLSQLQLGHAVMVPLGRGEETGYVVGRTDEPDFDPARIKPVSRLLDPVVAFTEEQLGFFRWVAGYYLAPLGMVIHTALPSQIRARTVGVFVATEAGIDALTARAVDGEAGQVLREIVSRPELTRRGLARRLREELDAKEVDKALAALRRRDFVGLVDKQIGGARGMVPVVRLREARHDSDKVRGTRMRALLTALELAGGERDLAELLAEQGQSARSSLKRLEAMGRVELGERENRDLLRDAPALGPSQPPQLNPDQQHALSTLGAPGARGTTLLFGVTGSGKTEVFLGVARTVLDRGRQVLVLVPEIGLTPQLVGRFRARFGDAVAVLHSGLTGAQRLAQWRRIRAGEATVAVGARSALFAPFRDLGLIVVDEEHDDSYKQDDRVAYNARDLSVVLGRNQDCPVVLASATPSLESWHNAQTGRYQLLRLPKRATPRPVPKITLVDMTTLDQTPRPVLAPEVEEALARSFRRGGQSIVLYNRRGFATMVQCTSCGATYECPNCGITMTMHRRARVMACHYCGLKRAYEPECMACGAPDMDELGKGTERVYDVLKSRFPDIAIDRMDADTTSGPGAHHRILSRFRSGETQLLVGTQIVAKGHDFPGVQVAVVVSADRGFRLPDFRAAERTAALVVQLAGRAGRGDHPGEVFVQTYKPDHYVLRHLDDIEQFYGMELRLRATLQQPPFTRLCLIRIDGVDRKRVLDAAEALARTLRQAARHTSGVAVLGPAAAALPRLVGRWRFQLLVRGAQIGPLRRFLGAQREQIERTGRKGIRVGIDVDPRSLM